MMSQAEERKHAKLSPSSSGRWLNCAGSIEVNAKGGRSSWYAEEGTAAHTLFDTCMTIGVDPDKFLGKFIYKDFEVTDDMADAVGIAIDWTRSYLAKHPQAKFYTEKEVDPYHALKCSKGLTSGTGDLFIDNAPEELIVMDYKHGAGIVVEVEGNTQTLQYALGYYSQFATRPYKRYRLVIIQPRARDDRGPVREVVLTHEELMAHAQTVRKRLKAIERDPDDRVAGKWCTFCAGAGRCKTLATYNMNLAAMEFGKLGEEPVDPHELDPEDLAYIVLMLPMFEKWMKAVYSAAVEFASRGGELPDLKLVHGKTMRSWSNEDAVYKRLSKTFREDEFAPRKLIGVAKVEQLLRSRIADQGTPRNARKERLHKAMVKLQPYIQRSQPVLHLAPESDPRPAVKRGEEFNDTPLEDVFDDE